MSKVFRILLAEDNAADVFLIKKALQAHELSADLHVMEDGEKALQFIEAVDRAEKPSPEVALLDLNLPRVSGGEVLARLRRSPVCGHIPVVIISASDLPRGHETAPDVFADHYFRKPSDYDQYMELGEIVKNTLDASKQVLSR